jgi:hypothetical protein
MPGVWTAGAPDVSVNVVVVSVAGSIDSLNEALMLALTGTPTASRRGVLDRTVGA